MLWVLLLIVAILLIAGLGGGSYYRRRYIVPPGPAVGTAGTPVVHNTIVTPGATTGTTVVEE